MELGFDANKRVRDRDESEGEDSRSKKNSRSCNLIDPEFIGFEEIGGKDFGGEVEKDASCYVDEGRLDVDINIPLLGSGDDDKLVEKKVEIIDISSDDDNGDEVEEIFINSASNKAVGKQIEQEDMSQWFNDLDLWLNDVDFGFGLEFNANTQDQGKGNGNASNSWLSLAPPSSNQYLQDFQSVSQNHNEFNDANGLRFEENDANGLRFEENVNDQLVNHNNDQLVNHNNDQHQHVVPYESDQLRSLRENAHTYAWVEGYKGASSDPENLPLEHEELLRKSGGPFIDALKIVIERSKKGRDKLIQWRPNEKRRVNRSIVPSLTDLSSKVLAENSEAIVSLELVPDILRRRFADLVCNSRKMNFYILQLLTEGSPTEICVKDCSGITEEQFFKVFKKLDTKCLMVLQLDFCGQCRLDSLINEILAQPCTDLSNLSVISLKGACCLSDDGLKALARSAPALRSMNLNSCSFLTHAGINGLSDSLGLTLRELYINDCHNIDPMFMVPALKNFKHLEVLSVAGNQTVSDQFVLGLIDSCGEKLKELDISDCPGLTNDSLAVIGKGCTNLRSLNISNLDNVTDLGLQYLADGCRFIRTFRLCRNTFSDEAIAAFLEASGQCMEELSLNYVSSVGPCTSFSISKCCPKLVSLDLSWCRKITNEALGLIVDSCLSLKQLKLFGCSQITEMFLNGHSNSLVQIIGLSLTPLWNANTFI